MYCSYFSKDALAISGIKVLRLLNEPTAAAVAFCFTHNTAVPQDVLVFHLGGGSFNVSLVALSGNFAVKVTIGLNISNITNVVAF